MTEPAHTRLLIGRTSNGTAKALGGVDHCPNVFEGLAAAREKPYEAIYLVLGDIPEPRREALRTLARIAPQSKRYLLVNMVEEPLALALQQTATGRLISDYYLLPLESGFQPSRPPAEGSDTPTEASAEAAAMPSVLETTDKDRLIHELQTLVTQDDLTGLKNRRYLRQFLPAILENARQTGCQVTLLLFDLDNFKHYNDAYGHSVGDAVLLQTGRLMRRCCRGHDVVARLGGDEFAVVFWDLPEDPQDRDDRRGNHLDHPRQAQFMAERFRREIAETDFECIGPKGKGTLTISGGLATCPRDGQTPEELYEKADQAMLQAKKTGKNKITIVGKPTQ